MNKKFIFAGAFVLSVSLGLVLFRPTEIRFKTDCNLKEKKCLIGNDQFQFEVDISPRPLDIKKDFKLTVRPLNFSPTSVTSYVIGRNFDHETTVFPLEEKSKIFQTTGNFPFCTEKVMKWRIHLAIVEKNNLLKVNQDFELYRE